MGTTFLESKTFQVVSLDPASFYFTWHSPANGCFPGWTTTCHQAPTRTWKYLIVKYIYSYPHITKSILNFLSWIQLFRNCVVQWTSCQDTSYAWAVLRLSHIRTKITELWEPATSTHCLCVCACVWISISARGPALADDRVLVIRLCLPSRGICRVRVCKSVCRHDNNKVSWQRPVFQLQSRKVAAMWTECPACGQQFKSREEYKNKLNALTQEYTTVKVDIIQDTRLVIF